MSSPFAKLILPSFGRWHFSLGLNPKFPGEGKEHLQETRLADGQQEEL